MRVHDTGLPLVISNFFQFFKISSKFLKQNISGSIFSLKLRLMYETVLNSIKTLIRYCKVILSAFFIENIL